MPRALRGSGNAGRRSFRSFRRNFRRKATSVRSLRRWISRQTLKILGSVRNVHGRPLRRQKISGINTFLHALPGISESWTSCVKCCKRARNQQNSHRIRSRTRLRAHHQVKGPFRVTGRVLLFCFARRSVITASHRYYLFAFPLPKVLMASITRITARMTMARAKISWK